MSVPRRFAPSPLPREAPWFRNRWLWLTFLALAVAVAWVVLPNVAARLAAARLRDAVAHRGDRKSVV